jgi:hypothetical protein
MKYIPLVALLLCQTIAIGAEELPEFKTQVTPYNAPRIILAQLPEAGREAAEEVCEDYTSEAECAAAPACTWEEDECFDADDLGDDDLGDDGDGDDGDGDDGDGP